MHRILEIRPGLLALLVLLGCVTPFLDLPLTTRLKASPSDGGRLRFYRWVIVYLWILAAFAWVVRGGAGLRISHASAEVSWMWGAPWRTWTAGILAAAFFVLAFMPGLVCLLKPRRIAAYTRSVKRLQWLMPHDAEQRRWFAVLSLTAGICEEWILRGVVLEGLHLYAGLSLTAALVVSSALFGWNHLYQGWRAVLGSGVIGFALGVVALLSGGLLLPMVLHCVLDLQTIVYFRPEAERAEHL